MKTLELTHIAAHLPYGVNVKHKYGICELHGFVGNNWLIDTQFRIHNMHTAKPILRSMSDITEEITHRGEKFVPIVELAKIAMPRQSFVLSECGCFACTGDEHGDYQFGYNICTNSFQLRLKLIDWEIIDVMNQPDLFDKLAELMFDYRGLIPAGIALDVTTLDKNPYEV